MADNLAFYENSLIDEERPGSANECPAEGKLAVRAKSCRVAEWQGAKALRIEDGLVVVPGLDLESGTIEAEIGVDKAAYPGVAFHVADFANYELTYGQPHTSGQWDALQYDPVFRGSNTWQIHHGPGFQKEATVPSGSWYSMKVDFTGDTAVVGIDGQPPLTIAKLAHLRRSGMIGLWTYLPAHFRNLRVYRGVTSAQSVLGASSARANGPVAAADPALPPGLVTEWYLDGVGVIQAERHGLVLLNRYLPSQVTQATLTRKFRIDEDRRVEFKYGFSDILSLAVDDVTIFSGCTRFSGFGDRDARGYAELDAHAMSWDLKAGAHTLRALVSVNEGFGWGFGLSARANGLRLLPAWTS